MHLAKRKIKKRQLTERLGCKGSRTILGNLLMEARDAVKEINSAVDLVLPPWIAFKDLDQQDMFWRMGLGEAYLYEWSKYYFALENKSDYKVLFPEPEEWEGFYD